MRALEFLSRLRGLDVKLWLEGERLRYSAPPGAMTPVLLSQLVERKAEVVAFLREVEITASSDGQPLRPALRGEHIPLSFAQQRLWVFDQLELHRSVYNVPARYRFKGPFDVKVLERSLSEIVRRHEILRTTFIFDGGRAAQVVSPATASTLPVVDLREFPPVEREKRFRQFSDSEARQPFDLAAGPLFRASLIRLDDKEHVLLLIIHHIVSDGWSMGIFTGEIAALYEAFSAGLPSPLPELPIQYADYAIWQRDWLRGEIFRQQLAYWKGRLGGALPLLELPADRPRPAVPTFRGATRQIDFPAHVVEGLKALSLRQGVTLFMTALAALKVLLYRYTGQEDVLVGTPIANRNRSETEALIGFFGNTLALRTDLSGDPSFSELLERVRTTALEAYAHQDLPFERLVDELKPRRDMSRTPLFQVMFVFNADPPADLHVAGVTISPEAAATTGTAKFDITFIFNASADGMRVEVEYYTELFEHSTITRLLEHYGVLIEGVIAGPHRRISALPLLTPEERRTLCAVAGGEQDTPVEEPSLQVLFETQAERTPDAVALKCGGQRLSYAELNRRANYLAHHLRALGVGPEVIVGLFFDRSVEMVIALLGVIKAGGAYLPLDPSYPKERITFMLEDAAATVTLTQDSLVEKLPEAAPRVVRMNGDWGEIVRSPGDNPPPLVSADNPAYVIYTSGSTGAPKGTLVSHSNVARLFRATQHWFDFGERDVWTLFHSYTFDFSVWEIWGALLYGGRLVIVSYLVSRSPESFYELLAEEEVTVLNQTPSAFR